MAQGTLPVALLQWTVSTVSLASFIRYSVYRREVGQTDNDWLRIAKIADRAQASYYDFNIASAISYEWTVTQVETIATSETESAKGTPVPATALFQSAFLHDTASTANYMEVTPQSPQESVVQDITFIQTWGRRTPTAHISSVQESSRVDASFTWDNTDGQWSALRRLLVNQRLGHTMCYRDRRGLKLFCTITQSRRRNLQGPLIQISISMQETHYEESLTP